MDPKFPPNFDVQNAPAVFESFLLKRQGVGLANFLLHTLEMFAEVKRSSLLPKQNLNSKKLLEKKKMGFN
jgi:hypothetical protein